MSNDHKSNSDKSEFIIDSLIDEYVEKLNKCIDDSKTYKDEISEKEAFFKILSKEKAYLNVFSPNSKEYDLNSSESEIENLKEKVNLLKKEEKKFEADILQLKEIKNQLSDKEPPKNNKGLNMLELQEQDRQRIARDLHDSTVQNLTSLIHKCELCSRLIDLDPIRTRLELNTMSKTLKSVINEIREIIYNLKPMSLEDLGLTITVERFINQLMMCHDIKIRLYHNDENSDILPVIKLSIFRMIQEACNNAIKHAQATKIEVKLKYTEDLISVSVKDNGKGFDVENQKDFDSADYHGYGLTIMKERVYLLSGTMKIESTINKGTIVTINIPITKDEGKVYE